MESNLFIKDWLTQSWGLKGPIICHLQAQESQRCSSSPNLKAWEAGKPRPEWEGPRNRRANIQRQKETGVSTQDREQARPSSTLLFYSCPQRTARHSPALVHMIFFTNSTNSNANHFQKHSDRHTQKQCFSFILINFFILALPGVLWDPTRDWTLVQGLNPLPHQ